MNKKARELYTRYLDTYAPYELDTYEILKTATVENIKYNLECLLRNSKFEKEEYDFIISLLKELEDYLLDIMEEVL